MKMKKNKKLESGPKTPAQPAATIPDPAALAEEAQKESRIIAARDYIKTINILRDQKSYSFRDIAAWFNERGVPLDNNEIYRAYMATVDPIEKQAMEHYHTEPDPED